MLEEVFRIAGNVLSVELKMDKDSNFSGIATVRFEHPMESVQAICILILNYIYIYIYIYMYIYLMNIMQAEFKCMLSNRCVVDLYELSIGQVCVKLLWQV